MVAITHVSSFTWTVGMHNLTWHDAKRKSKTVGSIFLPEAMVTFWSHVEVPLITVCFYIFKVLVLQKCLRLPQVCGNRMMIGISHSFSRTFDMLVSARVNRGILSSDFPQPSLGYFGAEVSGERSVGSFESLIFQPDLIYSWTLWQKHRLSM